MVRRKCNRKWIVWGMVLLTFVVICILVLIVNYNRNGYNDDVDSTGSSESAEEEIFDREENETEEEYSERMAEKKKVKQYEAEDPNMSEELSGAISYIGINNDILTIGTNIDQYLNDGNCELSLVKDGKVIYSTSSAILAEVSTSTCDGFNVPASGLSSGVTNIIIKLTANGKTGTINGEVNV